MDLGFINPIGDGPEGEKEGPLFFWYRKNWEEYTTALTNSNNIQNSIIWIGNQQKLPMQ